MDGWTNNCPSPPPPATEIPSTKLDPDLHYHRASKRRGGDVPIRGGERSALCKKGEERPDPGVERQGGVMPTSSRTDRTGRGCRSRISPVAHLPTAQPYCPQQQQQSRFRPPSNPYPPDFAPREWAKINDGNHQSIKSNQIKSINQSNRGWGHPSSQAFFETIGRGGLPAPGLRHWSVLAPILFHGAFLLAWSVHDPPQLTPCR